MKQIMIAAGLLFSFSTLYNIQSSAQDIKPHKIDLSATGSLNKTADDLINIYNTNLRYNYVIQNAEFNANTKWVYGSKSSGLSNNDVNVTVDGNLYHDQKKHFNSWVLGAFTSSYSLNIYSQFQAGAGLAYKIVFLEKKQESIKNADTVRYTDILSLRISDGIIYEQSNVINSEANQELYNVFRNSLRMQLVARAWNKVELRGTFFWQPNLQNITDRNILTDVSLGLKISNSIKFDTRFGYNFISRTAKENLTFTYGISTTFSF